MASVSEPDREQMLDALMRQWPSAVGVFIRHGIQCVGCSLARFHCLRDAAHFHGVDEDQLAREIAESRDSTES